MFTFASPRGRVLERRRQRSLESTITRWRMPAPTLARHWLAERRRVTVDEVAG